MLYFLLKNNVDPRALLSLYNIVYHTIATSWLKQICSTDIIG